MLRAEFGDPGHPTLDLHPLVEVTHAAKASIPERFAAFHAANEHVYAALIRLMEDAAASGAKRFSIRDAFGYLRIQGMRTTGTPYLLDNDFTAMYGRLAADEHPRLAPLLRLRERTAA